jgi:hypothetical protein
MGEGVSSVLLLKTMLPGAVFALPLRGERLTGAAIKEGMHLQGWPEG